MSQVFYTDLFNEFILHSSFYPGISYELRK